MRQTKIAFKNKILENLRIAKRRLQDIDGSVVESLESRHFLLKEWRELDVIISDLEDRSYIAEQLIDDMEDEQDERKTNATDTGTN